MKSKTAAAVFVISAIGCGNSGPTLAPISGTVTVNGEPLEGGVVSFLPHPSNKEGQLGEVITGPSGDYTAMTRGRSGLVPGKYRVVILKTLVDTAKVNETFKDDPFMARAVASGPTLAKRKKNAASPSRVEEQFDREVSAEGGQLDFDIKNAGN